MRLQYTFHAHHATAAGATLQEFFMQLRLLLKLPGQKLYCIMTSSSRHERQMCQLREWPPKIFSPDAPEVDLTRTIDALEHRSDVVRTSCRMAAMTQDAKRQGWSDIRRVPRTRSACTDKVRIQAYIQASQCHRQHTCTSNCLILSHSFSNRSSCAYKLNISTVVGHYQGACRLISYQSRRSLMITWPTSYRVRSAVVANARTFVK